MNLSRFWSRWAGRRSEASFMPVGSNLKPDAQRLLFLASLLIPLVIGCGRDAPTETSAGFEKWTPVPFGVTGGVVRLDSLSVHFTVPPAKSKSWALTKVEFRVYRQDDSFYDTECHPVSVLGSEELTVRTPFDFKQDLWLKARIRDVSGQEGNWSPPLYLVVPGARELRRDVPKGQ